MNCCRSGRTECLCGIVWRMSTADFYTGIVADVYTSLRSTTFDAEPYLEFVDRAGQPALELGCGAREARAADGATARYTVESEDYDQTTRTRRTRTRYELLRTDRREHLQREWIIHWHTPDSFGALARAAGLRTAAATAVIDGEFTVTLRRA